MTHSDSDEHTATPGAFELFNSEVSWQFDCPEGGTPRVVSFHNKRTDRSFAVSDYKGLTLVLSAATDSVQEPLVQVADWQVVSVEVVGEDQAAITVLSPSTGLQATNHFLLDGPTRRKWSVVTNASDEDVLLLDIQLDSFAVAAPITGGGSGFPLFIGNDAFAAVEYPSGENLFEGEHLTLTHFPGRVLKPGEEYTSHAALVSVGRDSGAETQFIAYIQQNCLRDRAFTSVYTPFGINNQWGPCSTLDDEECLDVLRLLGSLQRKGVRFDHFTLDTGWVDPASDLKRFRPIAYPNGAGRIIDRVADLKMKFGLWFATGWAAELCWQNPAAWPGEPPTMKYLNGYPARDTFPGMFCFGYQPYVDMLREAVVYHVRENGARFIKFDGGSYVCDAADHGHLPGKYSTERMYGNLIEIAEAAREAAPDVFIMWYWGLRSPFWALHGDTIFESGLHMEGSGTSSTPTLYYRDSVTLAQDQNAQYASLIPPIAKDSLGVWLSDTRWGNYMGKERWREAMVMDLGRGSLLFPNIWGDLYLLDDDDIRFFAWICDIAKKNETLFLQRRLIPGDPFKNEVYGYAHFRGANGFIFLNNAHFEARKAEIRLDGSIGLQGRPGKMLQVQTHFPNRTRLMRPDGEAYRTGDVAEIWLRPFEVLMLEVTTSEKEIARMAVRPVTEEDALALGGAVELTPAEFVEELAVEFVNAPAFEQKGFAPQVQSFAATVPDLEGPPAILAVTVRLCSGEEDWRYAPTVCDIVQVRARVGDQFTQLVAVPDARQFGNTQAQGCSWITYKLRLGREWAGQPIQLSVTSWLPAEVEAQTEAWVVKRWWSESARPMGDGYYASAPS